MAKYELSSSKNKVLLGDIPFTEFFDTPRSPYVFWQWVSSRGFDVGDYSDHPRVLNSNLHEAFGSKIPLRFRAAMYNTFIKDNVPLEAYFAVKRLGHKWKLFDPRLVNVAVTHNHLVQQSVKDNTLNVLPLMLHTGMDTRELKAYFGKGLWKRLANTSKTRMTYLAPLILQSLTWVDVRSGVLKKAKGLRSTETILLIAAKIAPRVEDYTHACVIIRDTILMGELLGETCNLNWSYNRWVEEHDRMSKAVLLGKFSDKAFTDVVIHEEGGYTFTLLNSQLAIAAEGSMMGHCVGSYAQRAASGMYMVFKVEGNGERATLGLYKDGDKLSFDQCYGRYNSPVSVKLVATVKDMVRKTNDSVRRRDGWTA